MENQNEIIEHMFGKGYKEKMIRTLMETELTDEELNELFFVLCDEINSSMITSLELVELIKVLPHNLSLLLINKQEILDKNELDAILRVVEYDEFVKDMNTFVRKDVSKFEVRFNCSLERKGRILTCEEIETLINKVIKKSNIEDKSFKNTHYEYDGDNKYLKLLVKARKAVIKRDNSKSFGEMYAKHKKEQLKKLIKKMKEYNVGVEIGK